MNYSIQGSMVYVPLILFPSFKISRRLATTSEARLFPLTFVHVTREK